MNNRTKKFNKIRSFLSQANRSTEGRNYFHKKEMEEIVSTILGKAVSVNGYDNYFYETLSNSGYIKQRTIDSHPIEKNLDFILNALSSKTKTNKPLSDSSVAKRNAIVSVSNQTSETSVRESVRELDFSEVILEKVRAQSISRITFDGRIFNISFK